MKKGFTLAEILIVLSIVGVIAVLTVPNMIQNTNNRTFVGTLESVSSNFKTVITQVMTNEHFTNLADSTYGQSAENFLKGYFKLVSYCGNSYTDCLASNYSSLNGANSVSTATMMSGQDFYCGTTQSGTVICLTTMGQDNGETRGSSTVVIDVNGKKSPNKNGRDLFSFNVYTDGKIGNQHETTSNDADGTTCSGYASTAGFGGACYSKVVADGWKMNY